MDQNFIVTFFLLFYMSICFFCNFSSLHLLFLLLFVLHFLKTTCNKKHQHLYRPCMNIFNCFLRTNACLKLQARIEEYYNCQCS